MMRLRGGNGMGDIRAEAQRALAEKTKDLGGRSHLIAAFNRKLTPFIRKRPQRHGVTELPPVLEGM